MHNLSRFFITLASLLLITSSYAIDVNVHSTSSNIQGLGFVANGAQHGGMGTNYQGSDMPKGKYTFGLRSNGKDVGCYGKGGKKFFTLTRNTQAVLYFNGRRCQVSVNSK